MVQMLNDRMNDIMSEAKNRLAKSNRGPNQLNAMIKQVTDEFRQGDQTNNFSEGTTDFGMPTDMVDRIIRQAMSQQQPQQQAPANAQPQQVAQTPQNAPVPTASPLNQAIAQQLGEDVPVPTARPNPNAVATGDANVMEQVLAGRQLPQAETQQPEAVAASPLEQAVDQQLNPSPADGAAAASGNAPVASRELGPGELAGLIAGAGAAGALAYMIKNNIAMTPDAMATFQANGVNKDDFSMMLSRNPAQIDPRGGSAAPLMDIEHGRPQTGEVPQIPEQKERTNEILDMIAKPQSAVKFNEGPAFANQPVIPRNRPKVPLP